MKTSWALGALLLPLLSGCSGSGDSPDAAATVTATATATVTATVTSTPEPPKTPATAKPGTVVDGKTVSVAALDYRTDVSQYGKQPGTRLDSVLVKTCVTGRAVPLSWYPWSLIDKDSGLYPAESSTYGDYPLPQYPFGSDAKVRKGQCVQGWIVFRVPENASLVAVQYANQEDPTQAWRLR